jgi:hypothetical protein
LRRTDGLSYFINVNGSTAAIELIEVVRLIEFKELITKEPISRKAGGLLV